MDKDNIDLRIDEGMLVIQGEKRHEDESREEGVYRSERFYGQFQRAVPLPADIDAENAEASFKKGVLSVRFPKKPSGTDKERRIEVKS